MFISQAVRDRVVAVAKQYAQQAINHAAGIPGNPSGVPVREDVAVEFLQERVVQVIEAKDHLVPVLGAYMDLPFVDELQRQGEEIILRAFIRKVYAEQELEKLAAKVAREGT